ncbi:hypothetical protein JCM8097_008311 [Rhodosporidiobolus ruineniae]
MTTLVHPLPLMASSTSTSSSSSPFSAPPAPASPPYMAPSSAAVDDDDLLALLGSDSFSLESARDKDLVLLQSFLQGVLPSSTQPAGAHPVPPSAHSIQINASAQALLQQHAALSGWNGWRPQGGDGAAAPYGSPMSFQSSAAPASSSYTAAPSSSLTGHHGGQHNPFLQLATPPTSSASAAFSPSSPFAASSSSSYHQPRRSSLSSSTLGGGVRAPACSRERVPTLGSFGTAGGAAPRPLEEQEEGQEGDGAAQDGGWKSRLRSARRAAQQDDDAMME